MLTGFCQHGAAVRICHNHGSAEH